MESTRDFLKRKMYTEDYFKELWKVIWRMTRSDKGKAVDVFVNTTIHFKHTNKMYIVANRLYWSLKNGTPCDCSKINIKFDI